jgi:intracellular septation protein A
MKLIKKSLISFVGGLFILLGAIFFIIPGPSLLFILPGLLILSFEYPKAKSCLQKCMKMMRSSAAWMDKLLRGKRYH